MTDSSKPVRVGIVGAGENTRLVHIPRLQSIPGVEITGVVNRRRESSVRVASEFDIPTVYDSWEELVASPDNDAIVIGTWPYLHCAITLAALEAGKHVMCEARMACNAEEARLMLEASRRRPELVAQVVPSPFSLHVDKTIGRLVDEGYLGDLLAVEIRAASGEFLDRNAPLHWRGDIELSGLNVMSLGIWYEALMRWIGPAAKVTAVGKVFVDTRHDPRTDTIRPVKIPEHLVVAAEMAGGAQATFLLSSVTGGVAANEATLFGSERTLRFRDGILSAATREDKEFSEIPIPPQESGGWRVEEEFIGAIRGANKIELTTFEDGLKYMEFTAAVARSMREERTVRVGE